MNQKFEGLYTFLSDWVHTNVLTWSMGIQWMFVFVAFLITALIWYGLERRLYQWVDENVENDIGRSILRALADVGNVTAFVCITQISAELTRYMGHSPRVLSAASKLAVTWIIIRLITSLMSSRSLARMVTILIWCVAALSFFGLLTPITGFLESLSFSMGDATFTALGAIKGALLALLFLQAAAVVSRFASARVEKVSDLSPSLKVLLIKTIKVLLYTAAILVAMSSVGIDLTSLAIFSSALGVGIGFGLKTVFSNYVAGILLLMDNSIKPGDTIEVGQVFGVVRDMHSRYASVLTRDGTEYLIPNEVLISGEVVNWTYSHSKVRIKIPVGISYDSDVELAMELMEKAASVPRVLKDPAPAARLVGFGDNAVDLQIRIWINDAEEGVTNVRSAVLLNIWKSFHEHGIEFPFPQRDVLLKPDSELNVRISKEGSNE